MLSGIGLIFFKRQFTLFVRPAVETDDRLCELFVLVTVKCRLVSSLYRCFSKWLLLLLLLLFNLFYVSHPVDFCMSRFVSLLRCYLVYLLYTEHWVRCAM